MTAVSCAKIIIFLLCLNDIFCILNTVFYTWVNYTVNNLSSDSSCVEAVDNNKSCMTLLRSSLGKYKKLRTRDKRLFLLFSPPQFIQSEETKQQAKTKQTRINPMIFISYKSILRNIPRLTSITLLIALIVGQSGFAHAATYTFVQTNWGGGASVSTASHPTNQAGWTQYDSKDSSISVINSGTDLELALDALATSSVTQTTDVDFAGGVGNGISAGGSGTAGYIAPCAYNHDGNDWEPTNGDAWDLDATAAIGIAGTHCNVGNFTLASGKTVYVNMYDGSDFGAVRIYANNATIAGTLDATGKGYAGLGVVNGTNNGTAGAQGPGGGAASSQGGTGGSHGGKGGIGHNISGPSDSKIYGSIDSPTDMGSGGGGRGGHVAGSGGGVIGLIISNSLSITGTVKANGAPYVGWASGGSGGSVLIDANSFSGTGSVQTNGGKGYRYSTASSGGGAGGRIAIKYGTKTFSGTVTSYAGGYDSNLAGTISSGAAGTVFYKQTNQAYGDLVINNNNLTDGDNTPIAATAQHIAYDTITVTKYGKLTNALNITTTNLSTSLNGAVTNTGIINSATLSVGATSTLTNTGSIVTTGDITIAGSVTTTSINANAGTVTIASGGVVTHPVANVAGLTITAANLDVQTGGTINVSEKGYAGVVGGNGLGTGFGRKAAGYGGSGAGYGGSGGGGNGVAGGIAYGSSIAPTSIGSSGGGCALQARAGGAGGGAIKLNVANTLTLSGSMTANGGVPISGGGCAGGGSGGSIWIVAGTLTGTGPISAIGGNADGTTIPGGGAGGRIALEYISKTFNGAITVTGGTGLSAGGVGTKYENGSPVAVGETSRHFASTEQADGFVATTLDLLKRSVMTLFGIKTAHGATADFVSSAMDLGYGANYAATSPTTLDFSADSGISFQLASSASASGPWNFVGPDGTSGTYYATSGATIHSSHVNARYMKYKAYFVYTSTDPHLNAITINYQTVAYAPIKSLVSSIYDSTDFASVLTGIQWTANTSAGATAKFQARTSPDGTTWTDWMGPDGTGGVSLQHQLARLFRLPSAMDPTIAGFNTRHTLPLEA